MGNESEARERIIQATIDLLNEGAEVDFITVRVVAQRANVGVGLINYHFHTRDNLLSIAIGSLMAKMAIEMREEQSVSDGSPTNRIRKMLKTLYTFGEKHEKLIQFLLTHGIINGDMDGALYLVPILKEIFGTQKDEIQLRIIALQILLPIQVASINPSSFHHFTGIDLHNIKQRDNYIDTLIDNLLNDQNT
ncbi:MAG TPA: TetR/AcrR family transcriptional regulator [Erysipelotrichaceae bacterium]|nr:TetR/AcrR family transcriptional regulator [Erysipelotrichaceae bacterium]